MIFRADEAKLIVQRKKTQMRRICTSIRETCRYETGKSYAIQPGYGKQSIGRLTITDIRLEQLGEITLKDARREGFLTTDDFTEHWIQVHGHLDRSQPVWVISFQLGDSTDRPRLLAARPGPGRDYVTEPHLAMKDEPEAVDAATQQRLSAQGTMRWQQEHARREDERTRKRLHERVAELEARERRGEAVPELRVIRDRLRKLKAS